MVEARLASHKKGASRLGAAIAFVDETGSTFRSRTGTTWAPVGKPPELRRVSKRREVSSIVALVAPTKRRKARLYARHIEGTWNGSKTANALRYFHWKVGRPLLIVWDRWKTHGASEVKALVRRHPKHYILERLPTYAPDLNPEEGCNSEAKAQLRNALPGNVAELRRQTRRAFLKVAHDPKSLRGYFHHAGLSLRGLT